MRKILVDKLFDQKSNNKKTWYLHDSQLQFPKKKN